MPSRMRHGSDEPSAEPKLAFTLGAYAREHPVWAITIDGDVIGIGTTRPQPLPGTSKSCRFRLARQQGLNRAGGTR
jgi:hypothetical protein